MQAYDFRKVAALLDGPTTIALRDAEPLTIAHERVLASFQRLSAADQRLSIEMPALRIGEDASAITASFHFRARDESILDIAASGEGIAFAVEDAKFAIDKAALEGDMPSSALADRKSCAALAATGRQDQHYPRLAEQGRTHHLRRRHAHVTPQGFSTAASAP